MKLTINVSGGNMNLQKVLERKYRNDLSLLGASLNDVFQHENELIEKLILEYYTTFEISDEFIEELKFVINNIVDMSLRNRVLCSYFVEKYITGRFDDYGFKYEKITFLS